MTTFRLNNLGLQAPQRGNLLIAILLIWGLVAVLGLGFLWLENGLGNSIKSYYLLPWAIVSGVVVLAPSFYLWYKKKFDPFHPLVFAAWSYIFPSFIVGALIISLGWSDPYFLAYIDDPAYNLPLSLVYVTLGFLGLTVGFAIPVGKYLAEMIEPRLPKWEWNPSDVWIGGILLLLAGIGVYIVGFIQGIMGYQKLTEAGIFDGLLQFLLVFFSEGIMLLWLAIFGVKEKRGIFYCVLAILIVIVPARMALLGSRGGLLLSIFPIAMAFQYSGRRLKWQHSMVFGGVLAAAVCIGIVYGTTFRNIKGSESRINTGDYVGQVSATLDYLASEDPAIVVQKGAQTLAERIENLSSLGVVVANYERLAPYEASYGLENNIVNDTLTSFIPRFIWNDKPPTSDARAYSDLYFNFGDNSFAISPFGDLLRNYGPVGVPLGMVLLGIYLRLIYSSLIDTPSPAMWKKVSYFPLLTLVSYEAFYATIFPSIIRTCIVLVVSLILVNLIVRVRLRVS